MTQHLQHLTDVALEELSVPHAKAPVVIRLFSSMRYDSRGVVWCRIFRGWCWGCNAKISLDPEDQCDPSANRCGDGDDTQRPGAEEVERIARRSGGDGQRQEPLAEPGQRSGALSLRGRGLPRHAAELSHRDLQVRHQDFRISGHGSLVALFQWLAVTFPVTRLA
jgi:hypothetical protein